MSGRKPLLENDEPLVIASLQAFSLRDQALVLLGLNTGFRITEILSLTVGQVWDTGRVKPQVKVSRAQLKGGRGQHRKTVVSRSVPLNAAVTAVLEQYLFARFGSGAADPQVPLFPSRKRGASITRWQANRIVHAVFNKAGLGSSESYGTHSLRKTFCRRVYSATKYDINLTRAIMGHASIATTQKYLHVDEAEMEAAVQAIGQSGPATVEHNGDTGRFASS
jgi:site-specific recombinase XerD